MLRSYPKRWTLNGRGATIEENAGQGHRPSRIFVVVFNLVGQRGKDAGVGHGIGSG
jgi:hypothetical protein